MLQGLAIAFAAFSTVLRDRESPTRRRGSQPCRVLHSRLAHCGLGHPQQAKQTLRDQSLKRDRTHCTTADIRTPPRPPPPGTALAHPSSSPIREITSPSRCHSAALPRALLAFSPRQGGPRMDHPARPPKHVETHTTGQLGGQVWTQWLDDLSCHLSAVCAVCSRPISKRTRPCCHRCHSTFNNPVSEFTERSRHPDTPDLDELSRRFLWRAHVPEAAQEAWIEREF